MFPRGTGLVKGAAGVFLFLFILLAFLALYQTAHAWDIDLESIQLRSAHETGVYFSILSFSDSHGGGG